MSNWRLYEHKNNPKILLWVRQDTHPNLVELRSPVNAFGYGSEDAGVIPPPERSAHSGFEVGSNLERFYIPKEDNG